MRKFTSTNNCSSRLACQAPLCESKNVCFLTHSLYLAEEQLEAMELGSKGYL